MLIQAHQRVTTFSELQAFIYATICKREQLRIDAFPMTHQTLRRSGTLCGFLFTVHGPRSTVFNAVWAREENAVHFYGSGGERFLSARVGNVPMTD